MIGFIILTFAYIFPAYIANSSAALFGGGRPIDFGKKFRKKRIFGDGKTIKGTLAGLFWGTVTGIIIGYLINNILLYTKLGFILALGAILGDIAASFLKRRFRIKQGQSVPVLDQLDFVMGALILSPLVLIPNAYQALFILIVTPAIHLFVNLCGYLLKLKKVPW